jgi:hypothetical protein
MCQVMIIEKDFHALYILKPISLMVPANLQGKQE